MDYEQLLDKAREELPESVFKTKHLLKYVLKELASPGHLEEKHALIRSKVPASRINQKIKEYADKFVICQECGKPDTKLTEEEGINLIKCTACGAKYPAKG